MGAGDVKLMAMVGSFLGPLQTVEAALMTLLAGGVLAVVVAAARGTLVRAVVNVRGIASGRWHPRPGEVIAIPASQSAGKLPYALAIAAGTAIHEVLARGGHSLFA
jgi:prepilin peptidase CpaA